MDKMNSSTDKCASRKIKWAGICKLLIFAAAFHAFGGCVKDDLYNTPHPDKGAVLVTTDWSLRSSDAVPPESYILRIGTQEQSVSGATNAFSNLLEPGKQQLLVCHAAQGITLSGTIATISTLPDGTLNPLPDYLFAAARQLQIPADDTLRVTVPMQQYIRRLALSLKLHPGDEQRIRNTAATLTGIASDTDLATGELTGSQGQTVIPVFTLMAGTDATETRTGTPETRTPGQPLLSTTLHLIGGVSGERQILTLQITQKNGDVHTIITDLTEMLKNFRNGDDMEPLELDAALNLPAEPGASATITDWLVVDNGEIGVN